MKIQVQAGICLALLASVIPIAAHAQTANGSPQKTGDKQGTGTAETNGTSGQRKSGQVVHQDFGRVQENKSPMERSACAEPCPEERAGIWRRQPCARVQNKGSPGIWSIASEQAQ